MICEEELVDLRIADPKSIEEGKKLVQLAFRLNHTMPTTDEYQEILKELFGDNLGEGSHINAPIQGVCFDRIKIGKNVVINSNMLAMARGGITIEDDVQIAANVQLLTNNHDPYERMILPCRPPRLRCVIFPSIYLPHLLSIPSDSYWASVCVATLPDIPSLICDFCSSDQRFAIQLPSDSTSRWTPLPSANTSYCQACSGLSPPSYCPFRANTDNRPTFILEVGRLRLYSYQKQTDIPNLNICPFSLC